MTTKTKPAYCYKTLTDGMRRSLMGLRDEVRAAQRVAKRHVQCECSLPSEKRSDGTIRILDGIEESCESLVALIEHQFPECWYFDCPDGEPATSSQLRQSFRQIVNDLATALCVLRFIVLKEIEEEKTRMESLDEN